MNPDKWRVTRKKQGSGQRWMVDPPGYVTPYSRMGQGWDDAGGKSFTLNRHTEALAYADRMARTVTVVLTRDVAIRGIWLGEEQS